MKHKRSVVGLILWTGLFAFSIFSFVFLWNHLKIVEGQTHTYRASIASIHEYIASQINYGVDSSEHHVLCIGNSITTHKPESSIGWYSNHGMAASCPQNDYCHILESMLKELNGVSTVDGINISEWEQNFLLPLDTILKEYCIGKDIIVIRLGENVTNVDAFGDALSELIDYCQQYTNDIVVTGQYWTNDSKESAVIKNVRLHHVKYVPLDWIYMLYGTECSPKVGDSLYDEMGKLYMVNNDIITTHPNDMGMKMIAQAIFPSLF